MQAYGFFVGTGLIVAFVVTVWAAYFVPLALRRYDEAHAQSALEVLSPLSRVIRRAPSRDEVPDDEIVDEQPAAKTAKRRSSKSEPRQVRPGLTRSAARIAARRRRRVLLTLLFANAVVGGLTGFAVVPLWSVAIPAGLLVVWLIACRVQVRHEYGIAGPRMPKVSRLARLGSSAADGEDTVTVSVQLEDMEPARKHVMENAALEDDALDEQLVIAVPAAASHGEMVWDPLPVTLPTYVTKPRAGRTVRTIDFNAPGVWTSGHVEGEDVELPASEASDEASADAQRRAAGE